MANIETISEKTILHGIKDGFSIKRISLIIHLSFLLLALFLSQTVMFDAAVPFLLPLWAIVRQRYENEKAWVLIGGMVGAVSLGLGQVLILGLQLVIFELFTRFRYWKLPTSFAVAVAILIGQFAWQTAIHFSFPPFIIQLYIYYEVVLAFFMTIFVQLFFVQPHQFWTKSWNYERVGAGLVILAMALTGMNSIVVSYFGLAPFVMHLAILIAGLCRWCTYFSDNRYYCRFARWYFRTFIYRDDCSVRVDRSSCSSIYRARSLRSSNR
ncbi:Stage II sporulation protein E OS=Ureibacillus acetophenoni OX=614649 GN=SAMN05877842_12416 PE=4 SV=1 [Ureibacillus acetophenoni]